MGSFVNGLFGGGSTEMPELSPMPEAAGETESAANRDAERKKLRARAGGVRSTLLGNQLGVSNASAGNQRNPGGLLGRSLQ